MPIIVRIGGGLDGHPVSFRSLELLRSYGVHVIYRPETRSPKNQVPANVILDELRILISKEDAREREENAHKSSGV